MVTLGDNLLKNERFAEAVLQYESALKLYPNNNAVKEKYQDAKNKKDVQSLKEKIYKNSFKIPQKNFDIFKKTFENRLTTL